MKGGKSQTVTTKPDADTLARNRELWERAQGVADQPYSATIPGYEQYLAQAGGLFGQGAGALSGDPAALAKYMNPYQQNVIDALGSQYDRARNQAALGANDAATQAGAFGGDRHALMVGERQGALDRGQMQDTANLLYGGFNDAMGRAAQSMNLGMGAQGFYGQQAQEQRDWGLRNLDIMRQTAGSMAQGQTQSQPMTRSPLGGAAGGAMAGASLGPWGAGIGAGLGLLGFI